MNTQHTAMYIRNMSLDPTSATAIATAKALKATVSKTFNRIQAASHPGGSCSIDPS